MIKRIILLINNRDNSVPITNLNNLDINNSEIMKEDNKRINDLEKQVKEIIIKVNNEFPDLFKKIFSILDLKANLEDLEQTKQKIISLFLINKQIILNLNSLKLRRLLTKSILK